MAETEYFLCPEDLYRLGTLDSPKLSHVRSRDVDTCTMNGICMVVANGKGISVLDKDGLLKSRMTGWVWRISSGTPMPRGLKLVHDKPHHYSIAPTHNMPVSKYKGLLEELAVRAGRSFHIRERAT